jgi:hypothetical protein
MGADRVHGRAGAVAGRDEDAAMANISTWVRGCECGKVHIDVANEDGSPLSDSDLDIIKALREAARQIERKEATRTPGAHEHKH